MEQHAIPLQVNQIIASNRKNYPASSALEDGLLITVVHFHCDIDYICSFIYLSQSHLFQLGTGDGRERDYDTECQMPPLGSM